MAALRRTLYLFSEPGEKNTGKAIEIAKKRALEDSIKYVVVASARGRTGVKAIQAFRGTKVKVIVVTESPDWAELEEGSKKKLKALKATVLRGVHAFHSVEKSFTAIHGGASISGIAEDTLRRISQGTKVGAEIAMMAADAGLVPLNQEIITIAGSDKGADTVLIVRPSTSGKFFDKKKGLEIREIVAIPRKKVFY